MKFYFNILFIIHRLSATERLEFTPDLQIHVHPDRGDGVSLMGGLRLRIVL